MIRIIITMISDNDKVHTMIKLVSEEAIHETFDDMVHLTQHLVYLKQQDIL